MNTETRAWDARWAIGDAETGRILDRNTWAADIEAMGGEYVDEETEHWDAWAFRFGADGSKIEVGADERGYLSVLAVRARREGARDE